MLLILGILLVMGLLTSISMLILQSIHAPGAYVGHLETDDRFASWPIDDASDTLA